ncbi:MAG: ribosome biosis GTPase YlqF [Myxococcaceae bacterium]|nr:ribosome biosis GTPase YlqF [Myxococcaceae bacterium]
MSIQWYPGHMTKARKTILEAMPAQDVVIEVIDARMPRASENPVLTELRGLKPCVKVLSKSDLADPEVTRLWLQHFEALDAARTPNSGKIVAIAITTERAAETRKRIAEVCGAIAVPTRGRKTARAMIVGIPNVGKSTLVNTLAKRKVANVGDEPAVTKGEQVVLLENGMTLSDNPGIMWPKIEDPKGGLRLAFGGAIPDAALDYENVAVFGASLLLERYPDLVAKRYKLTTLPADGSSLIDEIGRRRGCLQRGGKVDRHKAADIFIHDFRTGALGRITLERPDER